MNEVFEAFYHMAETLCKTGISTRDAVEMTAWVFGFIPSKLQYPSKRVVHLARFAKKHRVRKKNSDRIRFTEG